MPKTSLLVDGWEAADQRAALMAGHHLLGLDALDRVTLFRRRPPADASDASRLAPSLAFSVDQRRIFDAIPEPANARVDCVYRIGAPPDRHGRSGAARTVTFLADIQALRHGDAGGGRRPIDLVDGDDTIVVPSRWSQTSLIEQGVRPEKVGIVPQGVDALEFMPLSRADRAAVRANLGFQAEDIVLLHMTEAGADTGLDILLRAFARVRQAGVRVRLLLYADHPDGAAQYGDVIRATGATEPGLLRPDSLSALVTIPGTVARKDLRLIYGMADCYVCPDRGTAVHAPVIEAIATGCPVMVTRGGATDEICDDDVAWRVSGARRTDGGHPVIGSGPFIEPDVDELTDAIAEVARGRGFDRLRFAQARMLLLKRYTWRHSALTLADLVTGASDGGADGRASTAPHILPGLPQAADTRFAVALSRDLAAMRRMARTQVTCAGADQLSVIVQGPCLRQEDARGTPAIDDALASIRRSFPGAEIVVSTWAGSDIDGLDADAVVLSPDPGPIERPAHQPNNVNRMVTSTANGLAAATRPFCIKSRNDVLFASNGLLHNCLSQHAGNLSLERRIWIASMGTARIDTYLRPFHPCDMVQYGLTSDLRRLWDATARSPADVFPVDINVGLPRMCPEQALFIDFLSRNGIKIALSLTVDGRLDIISQSVDYMLSAFDVFDEEDNGVVFSPRISTGKFPYLRDSYASFSDLRKAWAQDRYATATDLSAKFQSRMNDILGGEASITGSRASRPDG